MKFSGHSTGQNPIIFCSENCFKQSILSPRPKPIKKITTKQAKINQQSQEQSIHQNLEKEPLYCDGLGCLKEIKNTYYYHPAKNDNNKFCCQECYTDYYGEYCYRCMD